MKPRLALAAAVLLLALPLAAAKKDTQVILEEVQRLTEAVNALQAQVGELLRKSAINEERISAMVRSQADLVQSRENTTLSLQYLKEELSGLKDMLAKLNDRLLQAPLAAAAPGAGGETQPATTPPVVQDPSSIYYAAYSDYIKENFDLAIEGFRQFIRSFPESGLADNSLYWIGECYYAQKKYAEAIATFNELLASYKDGDKAPAATLKKGYALIELGRQGEGIAMLKELISRHPLSEEASLARQKIKEYSE